MVFLVIILIIIVAGVKIIPQSRAKVVEMKDRVSLL